LNSHLEQVTNFIYPEKFCLPAALTNRITKLLENIEPNLLGSKLAAMQFDNIYNVLFFASRKSPRFFAMCQQQMQDSENRELFLNQALMTPFGEIEKLFHEAKRYGLDLLSGNISTALGAPENKNRLADRALTSPLEDTIHFLRYAKLNIPSAFSTVAIVLAHPENKLKVLALAKKCWPVELQNSVYLAREDLPAPVYQILLEYLSTELGEVLFKYLQRTY
jgi:hypothetical protein